MWQSFRKQLGTIRGFINELAPLVKHAYPGFSQPTSVGVGASHGRRSLSSAESVKVAATPVSAASSQYRLVTGFYGISKDIFFGKTIPNLDKQKTTFGDDSWFVAAQKNLDVLGVADGVGGWREMGIDPSKFSSSLMQQCKRIVEQDGSSISARSGDNINERTPLDILVESYQTLRDSKDPTVIGSSTACIIVFNRDSRLVHAANLGDSGFVIIRDNKIVHRSQEQCHYFNAPFQLAIVPARTHPNEREISSFNDTPESASMSSFELAEGDFLVVGTDGLWDNLSEGLLLLKISKIQTNFKSHSLEDLEKAAREIVNFTADLAQDPDYLSPFSISARKNGINFRGGKPDDITVLLARVTKS